MQRRKFWCKPCDYVCQAQRQASCPYCREPMTNMGMSWQPGKRGQRAVFTPEPAYHNPCWLAWGGLGNDAKSLLQRIDGEFVFDRHTGRYRVSRPVYDRRTQRPKTSRPKGKQANGRSARRNRSGRVYRRPVGR